MKVLVCGGRNYHDSNKVAEILGGILPDLIITGGATGADQEARQWAAKLGAPICMFPAQWDRYGEAAGPIRNAWMLEFGKPDLVVAFPGGRGTADMISKARKAGIEVCEVVT